MIKRVITLCLAAAGGWLWWEWDHLVLLKPSASPWQPATAAASLEPVAAREPCRNYNANRRALFGDLHIHTRFSFDARSRDMLGSVDDAYRFARGEAIGLGPFDASGAGQRRAKLQQPLPEQFCPTIPGSQPVPPRGNTERPEKPAEHTAR